MKTTQILLDKYEVEDLEHLKVDILANRGLSQLLEIDPDKNLTDYPEQDEATAKLLSRGDVLGVTQGESPAMRRLFRAIQPKSVYDCVSPTAMIRFVALTGRQKHSCLTTGLKTVYKIVLCSKMMLLKLFQI